jgi:hypothetical protein
MIALYFVLSLLEWRTENAGVGNPDAARDDHQSYEDDQHVDCQPYGYLLRRFIGHCLRLFGPGASWTGSAIIEVRQVTLHEGVTRMRVLLRTVSPFIIAWAA